MTFRLDPEHLRENGLETNMRLAESPAPPAGSTFGHAIGTYLLVGVLIYIIKGLLSLFP